MKLISAAAAMLLAVNASESIKMPLHKRKAMKSLKKHDSIVQDLAQTYSKDITWAPDYIGHVYVGTPGQQQDIVFDSGSGMLILATQNCTECSPVANSQGYYDEYYPSYSSTAMTSGYQCVQYENSAGCPELVYGSANVQTVRLQDKVCFNGVLGSEIFASSTSECVDNYPVFAIESGTGITGGIMGLTPSCGGQAPDCTPYVKSLYNQGTIPEEKISFNMGQDSMWLKNMSASLMIGGIDDTYVSGEIHYLQGYTDNYWAPVANGMYYDGNIVDAITTPTQTELDQGTYKMAVMDTGTSLMALSQTILDTLQSDFQSAANAAGCSYQTAQGFFMMECGCETAAPHFKNFDIVVNSNKQITMTPYAYLQEIFGEGTCAVAIEGIPSSVSGMNMYLLGDTFLRHFYTVFDYSNNQVGLALNSQYVNDGYTNSFLQVDSQQLEGKPGKPTQTSAYSSDIQARGFVSIKTIPPVGGMSSATKLYIALSVTVGLTIIGLVAFYFYKRSQMKKRALSSAVKDIKQRAANGFEAEAEQNLVQQE